MFRPRYHKSFPEYHKNLFPARNTIIEGKIFPALANLARGPRPYQGLGSQQVGLTLFRAAMPNRIHAYHDCCRGKHATQALSFFHGWHALSAFSGLSMDCRQNAVLSSAKGKGTLPLPRAGVKQSATPKETGS